MSLLRLLTTGKSLVGVNDTECRYRQSNQRLLPHFGPARNPFSRATKAEPAQTGARAPETHVESAAVAAKPATSGPSGEAAAALPREAARRTVSARFNARSLAVSLWRRLAALLSRWQTKLCGLFARSGGKAAKPAIPRFLKPPVQGELSLDRITVVRNDLSDADLEVVPAKTSVAPVASAATPRAVEKAETAKSAWGRVTTRLLGAGKT